MSFLVFNESNNEVTIIPEAKDLEPIVKLRKQNKVFFNDALKYIYHTYKKVHYFSNLPIDERKVKTTEFYLNNQDYRKFDNDELVKEIIKLYISFEYTQNEWGYEKIKIDISETIDSINDIPMVKVIYVDDVTEIEVKCPHCNKKHKTTGKVNFESKIDNSEERMDALKNLLTLQEMGEKFKLLIDKEKKNKEYINDGNSLLENNFFEKNKK
jgi:hypothetical protein